MRRVVQQFLIRIAACVAGILALPGLLSAGEIDTWVAETNTLLADESGYEEAVTEYRAILREAPERDDARLWLAKVLAWRGDIDASLSEIDHLLDRPQPEFEPRILRAEVLSWAGRYDPAIVAFESVLADFPDDARALRGLARVHRWAGRKQTAHGFYLRALGVEEDPEAREEFETLERGGPPSFESTTDHFQDNDGFARTSSRASFSFAEGFRTRIKPRAGILTVQANGPGNDRGYEAGLAIERTLGERLVAELDVGGRFWEENPAREHVAAALRYTTRSGSALAMELDHRDALDRTDSADATRKGLRDTQLAFSLWQGLGGGVAAFAAVKGAALSDDNLRHGAAASLDWQPFESHKLHLQLQGSYSGYAESSPNYYTPTLETGGRIGLKHVLPLAVGLSIGLDAGAGYGLARERGESNVGPAYDVTGSVTWSTGVYRITARAGRSQSQRGRAYIAEHFGVELGADY